MLFTFGKDTVVKNIARIVVTRFGQRKLKSLSDFEPLMKDFLSAHQPNCPVNFEGNLISAGKREGFLNGSFKVSRIDDLFQESIIGSMYTSSEIKSYADKIYKALDKIKDLDSEIASIFKVYVNEIAIQKSGYTKDGKRSLGGTSSKSIGKIWFAPRHSFSLSDYIELVAHELTHNLIFVDELNYGHFEYNNMGEEEYFAKSAILNKNRPMDKVFHSIVVAAEILQWRENLLANLPNATVHPESSKIRSSILESIKSIYANPKAFSLMKDRPKVILERIHNMITNRNNTRSLCS